MTGASDRRSGASERRLATVLFADLVDFTAFSERRGEEAAYSLMEQISGLLTDAIHAQGGTVKSFTGDGVMALFGVPIALEDSPLRACRAALVIQQRIASQAAEIEKKHGLRPQMRIGINTGPMIIGEVKSGESTNVTAIGDTVNLASRLQSLAQPGAVVLSEATHRLLEGLVVSRGAGEHYIKGKAERQKVYHLQGIRQSATRFDRSLNRGLTAYVGRTKELETLERGLDEAAGGIRVIDLVGEPGIGKSRLIHEFRGHLGENRFFVLSGNCTPDGQQTPFLPFIDVVRGSFRISEGEAAAEINRKLEKGLLVLGLASQHNLGLLLNLLGLKPPKGSLEGLDGVLIGLRTRDLLLGLLRERCRIIPVVMVIEDIHWIDSVSEELLARVITLEETPPLLVIHTRRPEYHLPWADAPQVTALKLDPLSSADTAQIFLTYLGMANLPPPLARLVTDRAEGNPMFVEEIANYLVERGVVRATASGVEYDAGSVTAALPSSVQGLLTARMDRLAPSERALLQAAAVIGRRFAPDMLAAVAEPGSNVDEQLLGMQALDLIFEDHKSGNFLFKHALVRDVAYDGLLSAKRTALHLKVADAIERRGSNRIYEVAEQLAYHYDRAGSSAKTFHYSVMAGEKSLEVYSLDQAKVFFERAIALFESKPDCAEGVAFAALIADTSILYYLIFEPGKTKRLVEKHLPRLTALGDLPQSVTFWCYYSVSLMFLCQYREAIGAATNSFKMAERLGDDQSMAFGRSALLTTKAMLGELSPEEAECHRLMSVLSTPTLLLSLPSFLKIPPGPREA